MRKDVIINIDVLNKDTNLNDTFSIGISGENLQGNLIFKLSEPIIGIGWLLIEYENTTSYIRLDNNITYDSYYVVIKNTLLNEGITKVQLRITETENQYGVPVFKSSIKYLTVSDGINAILEEPDEYPSWLDQANSKILQIDDKISEAEDSITNAENATENANTQATYAKNQGDYAKEQGDYAKEQGESAKETINNVSSTLTNIQNAENIRIENETQRISNENLRVSAENIRIENENNREEIFKTYENTIKDLQARLNTIEKYDYLVLE